MKTLHLYFDEDDDSFEADLDESRWLDSLVEDNQWEAPVPDKIITIETMVDIPALASHLTHLFDKRLRYEVVFDTEGDPPRWPFERKVLQLGSTGTFEITDAGLSGVVHERRPTRLAALLVIREWLSETYPELKDERIGLLENGDRDSAPNKCGWAWWIYDDDDTSYIKEDLTVEWYGHSPPEEPA